MSEIEFGSRIGFGGKNAAIPDSDAWSSSRPGEAAHPHAARGGGAATVVASRGASTLLTHGAARQMALYWLALAEARTVLAGGGADCTGARKRARTRRGPGPPARCSTRAAAAPPLPG